MNLLAALIGFLVARLVSWLRYLRRTRNVRKFWRIFRGVPTIDVVVPIFEDSKTLDFEASGLLGKGDLYGLTTLQETFLKIGVDINVVEHKRFTPARSRGQVLIGSPDSNIWTRYALEKLNIGVAFGSGDRWNIVDDSPTGSAFTATADPQDRGTVDDVGVVISAQSPLSIGPIVVLAGAYGYGTQAAAQLVTQLVDKLGSEGLEPSKPFELVFEVAVRNKEVLQPEIRVVRNL